MPVPGDLTKAKSLTCLTEKIIHQQGGTFFKECFFVFIKRIYILYISFGLLNDILGGGSYYKLMGEVSCVL